MRQGQEVREGDHHNISRDIVGEQAVLIMFFHLDQRVVSECSEEVFTSHHLCSLPVGLGTAVLDTQQLAGTQIIGGNNDYKVDGHGHSDRTQPRNSFQL